MSHQPPQPLHPFDPPPLRIARGRVIDPANNVDIVRDLLLHQGRIVETLPPDVTCETVDAAGLLVMPGAIDMHTHVASRGVAIAHALDPDLVPSPRDTAARYLQMGYTTVVDPAVPVEDVSVAHATLDAMPGLDAGFLLELGAHDELLHALAHHDERDAIALIDRLIAGHRALGLKLVSLRHPDGLDAPINNTAVTPRALIRFAAAAGEHLRLPHPVQLHVPDLGAPDNITNTLAALDALAGRRGHLAHAQFYAYRRNGRGELCSAAETLCDYLAAQPHVTADAGCIAFGPALMVTRDHLLADHLARLMGRNVTRRHGWSVMPMRYDAASPVNAVQWAIGLELILRSAERGILPRLAMSVDHPNGGPFTAMPALLELLANRDARDAALREVHPAAAQRTGLAHLHRELTVAELVTITRAAPAAALGLTDRGHLGTGAVADLVIADHVWAPPRLVIKSGHIACHSGHPRPTTTGTRLHAAASR